MINLTHNLTPNQMEQIGYAIDDFEQHADLKNVEELLIIQKTKWLK
ncbi:DnaD-like helicase loader [Staphylococcus phage S-CoN_Ph26]|nr:DnaD-like helicase loader [Staphylococcus phage S-CoN_Ph26]